jgi:hypothetical protein
LVWRRGAGPQGGGGTFNFTDAIEAHVSYAVWMLTTMRDRGLSTVDVTEDSEERYAEHCRDADIATAPLRDCLSYYNGEGNAEPGSLAYYGGPKAWHDRRIAAQTTHRSGRDHEDLVAATGMLEDGIVTNHLVNWLSPMKERTTVITGERGAFLADKDVLGVLDVVAVPAAARHRDGLFVAGQTLVVTHVDPWLSTRVR